MAKYDGEEINEELGKCSHFVYFQAVLKVSVEKSNGSTLFTVTFKTLAETEYEYLERFL